MIRAIVVVLLFASVAIAQDVSTTSMDNMMDHDGDLVALPTTTAGEEAQSGPTPTPAAPMPASRDNAPPMRMRINLNSDHFWTRLNDVAQYMLQNRMMDENTLLKWWNDNGNDPRVLDWVVNDFWQPSFSNLAGPEFVSKSDVDVYWRVLKILQTNVNLGHLTLAQAQKVWYDNQDNHDLLHYIANNMWAAGWENVAVTGTGPAVPTASPLVGQWYRAISDPNAPVEIDVEQANVAVATLTVKLHSDGSVLGSLSAFLGNVYTFTEAGGTTPAEIWTLRADSNLFNIVDGSNADQGVAYRSGFKPVPVVAAPTTSPINGAFVRTFVSGVAADVVSVCDAASMCTISTRNTNGTPGTTLGTLAPQNSFTVFTFTGTDGTTETWTITGSNPLAFTVNAQDGSAAGSATQQ